MGQGAIVRLTKERENMAQVTGLISLRDRCDELRRERDELLLVCERAQQDINWMLNNHKFLNSEVLDYLENVIVKIKGKT